MGESWSKQMLTFMRIATATICRLGMMEFRIFPDASFFGGEGWCEFSRSVIAIVYVFSWLETTGSNYLKPLSLVIYLNSLCCDKIWDYVIVKGLQWVNIWHIAWILHLNSLSLFYFVFCFSISCFSFLNSNKNI